MCTCSEGVTRRQAMQAVAAMAAAFAAGSLPLGWARAADGKTRKEVLAGFRHVRSVPIVERIGHRLCTVAVWPTVQR